MQWRAIALFLALVLAPSIPVLAQPPDQVPASSRRVLLEDNFDDPAAGWLPRSSPNPSEYLRGYEDGEYFIEKLDPQFGLPIAIIPGSYSDSTVAVDVRLVGETEGRYIAVACRRSPNNRYEAVVDPAQGRAWITRWVAGEPMLLTARQPSDAIARGEASNHLELTCAGNAITLAINGREVVSGRDSNFTAGEHAIGANAFTDSRNTAHGRFDNLVVYEVATPPTPTPAPTPTIGPTAVPRVILSDNFEDPANGWLSTSSPEPNSYALEYSGGEYAIRLVDLSYGRIPFGVLPGTYQDTSLAVDARLVGETAGRYIVLACRSGPGKQYRFSVYPATRSILLSRWDGSDWTTLAQPLVEALRRDNATNRLELRCVGSTITATINGTVAANVEDATHRDGVAWIGVAGATNGVPAEARFDNLVLTQH